MQALAGGELDNEWGPPNLEPEQTTRNNTRLETYVSRRAFSRGQRLET